MRNGNFQHFVVSARNYDEKCAQPTGGGWLNTYSHFASASKPSSDNDNQTLYLRRYSCEGRAARGTTGVSNQLILDWFIVVECRTLPPLYPGARGRAHCIRHGLVVLPSTTVPSQSLQIFNVSGLLELKIES